MDHLDRIQRNGEHTQSIEDLTEQDDSSNLYSNRSLSDYEEADSCKYRVDQKSVSSKKDIELNKLNGKSDQMFFEFFGMYTKESIKVQKRTGAK